MEAAFKSITNSPVKVSDAAEIRNWDEADTQEAGLCLEKDRRG